MQRQRAIHGTDRTAGPPRQDAICFRPRRGCAGDGDAGSVRPCTSGTDLRGTFHKEAPAVAAGVGAANAGNV